MPFIRVKVTAAHIASAPARGYGPRIIIAALKERLVQPVFVAIDTCWVTIAHEGIRHHVHLPLHMLPYTYRSNRVPLLNPLIFRIPLPAELVRRRSRAPRRPPP